MRQDNRASKQPARQRNAMTAPAAAAILLIPLFLTLYAWKATSESAAQRARNAFEFLVEESEKSLLHQIQSYHYALLGVRGFFDGSEHVSSEEWKKYVTAMNLPLNFPGIRGLGFIEKVDPANIGAYEAAMRRENQKFHGIRPEKPTEIYYIIKRIEPENMNLQAVGFNVGSDDRRRAAAELAANTGEAALTRPVRLIQEDSDKPAFLLMLPFYNEQMPTTTPEQRRAALIGWVYAPFIAEEMLQDITKAQGILLDIEIKDGNETIYNSHADEDAAPSYSLGRGIGVMQQNWSVTWRSTESFEKIYASRAPFFILLCGLTFTMILGAALSLVPARDEADEAHGQEKKPFALPAAVFTVTLLGSYLLYTTLKGYEAEHMRSAIVEQATKMERLLTAQTRENALALRRMAQRWQSSGGTAEQPWRDDAGNYISQIPGLRGLAWLDAACAAKWSEPGNAAAALIACPEQKDTLSIGSTQQEGFSIYAPLHARGNFDGFIAADFNTAAFIDSIVTPVDRHYYAISINDGENTFYRSGEEDGSPKENTHDTRAFDVQNRKWTLHVAPTRAFVEDRTTFLPELILSAGAMIAALLSLTAHFMLLSRQRAARLEKSNRLNEGILSSAPYMVVATDTQGNVILFNRTAEKLLGYTAAEIIGKKKPDVWHDSLEVSEREVEIRGPSRAQGMKTFAEEAEAAAPVTREWTFVRKDGSRFPASLTICPLRDGQGRVTGYIGMAEDITQRREIDRLKSEFISVVSHELRTPLTSIRGALGLVDGAFADTMPEKVRDLVGIAHKNCERLILLINDILDIDKIAAGKMKFDIKTEDAAELIHSGIEANAAYADKFNVIVEARELPPGLCVRADANRWQQVFANLLSNAVKFSQDGGVVTVGARKHGRMVRVTVRDRGPGIPEEFKGRIFARFSQADSTNSRAKGGTGLGLSISRDIVRRMGGDMGFDTIVGEGTSFWFDLPVAAEETLRAESDDARLPRVLHVEDDADLTHILAMATQGVYDMISAPTLFDARRFLSRETFSAIILDIGMPDGSGFQLIDEVEKLGNNAPMIVILSANEVPEEIRRRVSLTMVKSKVSESYVLEAIRKCVEQSLAKGETAAHA